MTDITLVSSILLNYFLRQAPEQLLLVNIDKALERGNKGEKIKISSRKIFNQDKYYSNYYLRQSPGQLLLT